MRITLSDGSELAADEILLATGRAPRTADLGLETVGLTPGDWLTVDDTFRATAIADVHRLMQLATSCAPRPTRESIRPCCAVIGARANGEPSMTPRGAPTPPPPTTPLCPRSSSPTRKSPLSA